VARVLNAGVVPKSMLKVFAKANLVTHLEGGEAVCLWS
jgi:hypothetical protein